eukprot:scaffold192800_cov17-Tisochrysis_lutea.AAC.2
MLLQQGEGRDAMLQVRAVRDLGQLGKSAANSRPCGGGWRELCAQKRGSCCCWPQAYVPRRVVLRDVCVCVELGGCVRCWGICCCCCCYSCCLPVLERSYRLVLAANAAHVRMHASGERLPHVRGGRDATAAAAAAGLMSMFLGTC